MFPYVNGTLVRGVGEREGGPASLSQWATEWGGHGEIVGLFGKGDLGLVLRVIRLKGDGWWMYRVVTTRGTVGWVWNRLIRRVR